MTDDEKQVLKLTAKTWDAFLQLERGQSPSVVDDDLTDFRRAIHELQRILITRAALRESPDMG